MGPVQVPTWNIPYQRNPLFTGREEVLKRLYTSLRAGKTTALSQPQAISGLGGIGKTQTAVEYAYRYQQDYNAVVWVKAESRATILSDFVTIAHLLNLPEQQEQEQQLVVDAVRRWFQDHTGWLLIFDNADDLSLLREFLPTVGKGHILLTTRAQATSRIAQRIEVERLEPEEAALFLLHRASILDLDAPLDAASTSDRATAMGIAQAMDGLPLALDQAGAFIEETRCSLSDYLQLFQTRQTDLLQRRGKLVTDHPDPVATIWSLSFENVQQANPAAADLLRLTTFLDPDLVQEEIFTEGASELGSVLQPVAADLIKLNEAIGALLNYSLVRRNPAHTLTIHRLVQAVLKHSMNRSTQRRWAERAVRAVNLAFPQVDYDTWLQCQQYLPHAQACTALIKAWNMNFPEAAHLLMQAGYYLWQRAEYAQAEPFYQQALSIYETVKGPDHPDTAYVLHRLALLYQDQGKYEQAEPLYKRALAIREKALGPDHPNTAATLHELASLYQAQGQYEQAEPLYQRSLSISETVEGPDHPNTAETLHELARLYQDQGKYEQAEPLYQRALSIKEKVVGPNHPSTADTLHELARLYQNQGKYEQAEPLYQRALSISEAVEGPDHPDTAVTLHNLARLYQEQGKYEQAEPLYQRALSISETVQGPDHPSTATTLQALGVLYQAQGKYEQAEPLYQRALRIYEKALVSDHPFIVATLHALASLYQAQGKYEQAESLYQRARSIREQKS